MRRRARSTLERMIDVQPLVDWLVEGAAGAGSPDQILKGTCDGLLRAGVPLDRAEAFVRTLHPNIAGRSFVWRPGEPVEVKNRSFTDLSTPAFLHSPMAEACNTGEYVQLRLDRGEVPPILLGLAGQGLVDFVAAPMRFLTGQNQVVTFQTRLASGFGPEHLAAFRRVMPPLSRVGEIYAQLRTATNLLSTYVGRNAGSRILRGQIQLGDTDTVKAVIWFSDLRGFTALSRTAQPAAVIRALNELFGCQIPPIEKRGGEVLKFIGDGLLAIFPYDGAAGPPAERCAAALDAASEAFAALESVNAARRGAGDPAIAFGLALHLGEVSYGNIGGASRMDFTCIGPAVNLAARLETVASKLGRPLVVSEAFATTSGRPMELLGHFELKGVDVLQAAFAPAPPAPALAG
ncbi:MAG TPA: adenylate/guanylate cyclase domain-containing protein [Myxococcales bacterium]|nr:adenylate/guanylate cyclase domain-containing protein [Myxococcales bacterium]